jgi:uncharacterized membrane protein
MISEFGELLAAGGAFLLTHIIPAIRPLRQRLTAWLGLKPYIILYSLLSLAVLGWVGLAYSRSPYEELWMINLASRLVPILLMPLAGLLLVCAISSPNPLSIGVGAKGYDPERPGILRLTRHPLVWSFIFWAGSHVPPNGDVASLLMFGLFFALALVGPLILDFKHKKSLGLAEWQRLAANTSNWRLIPALREIGPWRMLAGLVLYGLVLHFHLAFFGVDPLSW